MESAVSVAVHVLEFAAWDAMLLAIAAQHLGNNVVFAATCRATISLRVSRNSGSTGLSAKSRRRSFGYL